MTRSSIPAGHRTGRVRAALAIALSTLTLAVMPQLARADDDSRRGNEARDDHREKDRAAERHREDERRRESQRRDRYENRGPVYVPPPVYYVDPPAPGINFILPLEIRVH